MAYHSLHLQYQQQILTSQLYENYAMLVRRFAVYLSCVAQEDLLAMPGISWRVSKGTELQHE